MSERTFGLVVSGVFLFWACIPLARHQPPRPWLLIPSAIFLLLGAAWPHALIWPKRIWLGITTPLGEAVQFVLMAILYVFVITPVGLFFRLTRRDALHRRPDPKAATYWTRRSALGDMTQQF